jgi:hypothetical protein
VNTPLDSRRILMKRSPVLAALLAAAAIVFGSAGTVGAHESASAVSDDCGGSQSDQPAELSGDTTCDTVAQPPLGEQAPPVDQTVTPDSHPSVDMQGPAQVGQSGLDEPGATQVDPSGTDSQSTPHRDEGTTNVGRSGTQGPASETADEAAKRLGQLSTDDAVIQTADPDAED